MERDDQPSTGVPGSNDTVDRWVERLRAWPDAVAAALQGRPMTIVVTVLSEPPRAEPVLLTRDGHVVAPATMPGPPDVELSGTLGELSRIFDRGIGDLAALASLGIVKIHDPASAAGRLDAVLAVGRIR